MKDLSKKIKVALGQDSCDLVLKNATFINVFTQKLDYGDIGICGDTIVGIGTYHGKLEIDCTGKYVSPGFIDAHVHIESTMVIPEKYSKVALANGVTTVIADPHEIANVEGIRGIEFMLNNSKNTALDIFFMLPSCVPATPFEDNGSTLGYKELMPLINNERVLGLGEVMDVPAVLKTDENMMKKLLLAKDKHIDGHAPLVSDLELNGYLAAGIKTDHECSTPEEALEKVRKGMCVLIREGSAAKNLSALIKAVDSDNYGRFLFCTDDRHLEDLLVEGSINNCIRGAIKEGLDPIKALTIASYNAAQCYNLRDRGAIAPGLKADLVVFDNLKKIEIIKVIKSGLDISSHNKTRNRSFTVKNSVKMNFVSEDNFKITNIGKEVNVIKCKPQSLETKKVIREAIIENGYIKSFKGKEILKLGVFERHKNTGKYSIGFVEGLGLKGCSIAQSIAHDSHNIIVVGDSDNDMAVAVNSLITIGGGVAIAAEGKLIAHLSLPIAGIMTFQEPNIVVEGLQRLIRIARSYGLKAEYDPFITLSFLALPVIPELKLTARGLFDYNKFDFINLCSDSTETK